MNPKVSIAIPVHNMDNRDFFLERCLASIREQSFQDFEIVITEDGTMSKNFNSAFRKSVGEIVKPMAMDDFFSHKDALKNIVAAFSKQTMWVATGCSHTHGKDRFNDHYPSWNRRIYVENTIGCPSVIAFRKETKFRFDESLHWLMDCEAYKRMSDVYGPPYLLDSIDIVIGVGEHQTTNKLSEEAKAHEVEKVTKQYEKN